MAGGTAVNCNTPVPDNFQASWWCRGQWWRCRAEPILTFTRNIDGQRLGGAY